MSYGLMNAVEMNRKNPDTFKVPPEAALWQLKIGDHVKLGFQLPTPINEVTGERMWVTITHVTVECEEMYRGLLRNHPSSFDPKVLKYGDEVFFSDCHILSMLGP